MMTMTSKLRERGARMVADTKARRGRRRRPLPVRPSPEAWKEIRHDQRLTAGQLRALQVAVEHAITDIEQHEADRARKPDRAAFATSAARIEKALVAVHRSLADTVEHHDYLPGDFLALVGETLSVSALGKGAGSELQPLGPRRSSRRARSEPIEVREVEAAALQQRRALGIRYGAAALDQAARDLAGQLRTWLDKNREHPGGAPADHVRAHMIHALAQHADSVLARPATGSKGGRFVRLCEAVFMACELEVDGLEPAIERSLRD
jgi:hypothetical protein